MRVKLDHYTYSVTWSNEDQEYVGLCAEFPSLSWLDETPEKAFSGIRQVVAEVVADMRKEGEKVPVPISIKITNYNLTFPWPTELYPKFPVAIPA